MSDDKAPEEPTQPKPNPKTDEPEDPVADLKKGIGLLFKAAKSVAQTAAHRAKDNAASDRVERVFKKGVDELHDTIDRLQTDKVEGAVKASLQEIGRALGNVAQTIERELTKPQSSGATKSEPPPPPPPPAPPKTPPPKD